MEASTDSPTNDNEPTKDPTQSPSAIAITNKPSSDPTTNIPSTNKPIWTFPPFPTPPTPKPIWTYPPFSQRRARLEENNRREVADIDLEESQMPDGEVVEVVDAI